MDADRIAEGLQKLGIPVEKWPLIICHAEEGKMADSLVVRLAEKWTHGNAYLAEDVARWWLNAIAEELEAQGIYPDECSCPIGGTAALWLREQAGKP